MYIPPPLPLEAKLLEKVTLVSVGLLWSLYIPPPLYDAELPEKVPPINTGQLLWLYIPPPPEEELILLTELREKTTSINTGLL